MTPPCGVSTVAWKFIWYVRMNFTKAPIPPKEELKGVPFIGFRFTEVIPLRTFSSQSGSDDGSKP